LEEVLTPTYWFTPGDEPGEAYSVTISFSGRRLGTKAKPRSGDRFVQEQTVEGIVPASGPVAVTTEVRGINPGEWEIAAAPVKRPDVRSGAQPHRPGDGSADGVGGLWERWRGLITERSGPLETAPLPFSLIPGIRRLVWAPLVLLGVALGLVLQSLLLARADRSVGAALAVSGIAVFAGWVGAKGWYVAVHRGHRFNGWCIQGAILGGAVAAALVAIAGLDVSVGAYLNAAAPGLMLGLAVGKPGCFWAGCCSGRPTASRWGIWSSDRKLGIRRIPAQFMEALLGLFLGVAALAIVLVAGLGSSGALLVGVVAAYTIGRQLILPLRAEPRQTAWGRRLTMAAAALALVGSLLLTAS
jgi:phosphatidylglycerol---prolipoprotein diacylglyceryl transferase